MARTVSEIFIKATSTVAEAIACIDRSGRVSLALVIDDEGRLLNTITDGDVRRGLLAGVELTDTVSALLPIKARTPHPAPVTAPAGIDSGELLKMMQQLAVRQIPLVDEAGRVVSIVILADLLPQAPRSLRAMVMAGGQGMRLRPLTDDLPKPMLPVGGRPLMEHLIEQLRDTGISRIGIATHYCQEKIIDHFGDGRSFGVSIDYVREDSPLGTGGALGLMERPSEPVLVINGDILTGVDFRSMFAYHQDHETDLTVAVRRYEVQVPYGVIDCDGPNVRALREKPTFPFFVNAGIYLLEPSVFDFIPAGEHSNMTDLIARLIHAGRRVVSFPICEYWLDIGQHDSYQQAQDDVRDGKLRRTASAML